MGSNKSALLPQEEIQSICEETGRFDFLLDSVLILMISGFTSKQLERLYVRFQELERRNSPIGFLTREDLLNIREIALNPLGERLVDVIIQDYGEKKILVFFFRKYNLLKIFEGDFNKLNFRQFTNVFARFRRGKSTSQLNTKEKKLLFLFSVCIFVNHINIYINIFI
jgi:calcineurin B family protein 1